MLESSIAKTRRNVEMFLFICIQVTTTYSVFFNFSNEVYVLTNLDLSCTDVTKLSNNKVHVYTPQNQINYLMFWHYSWKRWVRVYGNTFENDKTKNRYLAQGDVTHSKYRYIPTLVNLLSRYLTDAIPFRKPSVVMNKHMAITVFEHPQNDIYSSSFWRIRG